MAGPEDQEKSLRIAVISAADPEDKSFSSGVVHYMTKALRREFQLVEHLGPSNPPSFKIGKLCRNATRLFLGKNYDYQHSLTVARAYARHFERRLGQRGYDLIFAPEASSEIALLNTELPIIYASDATFKLMIDYYPYFTNLMKRSVREENYIEKSAIEKSRALVFYTGWAARSAIEDYGADERKVNVINVGADIDQEPARDLVLRKKEDNICDLLFVGVDWVRKGGEIAVEAHRCLYRMGIEAELTICGCEPPYRLSLPGVRVIPYLDKNDKDDQRKLMDLYLKADFLILPTRAETAGFVFCEAAAFGLPVITTDTGGVKDLVLDGKTGVTFPLSAKGEEYAEAIRRLFNNKERYWRYREAARGEYELRLNWSVWGKKMKELIMSIKDGESAR